MRNVCFSGGEAILCILQVYVAEMQRRISFSTLRWKFPFSALPRELPTVFGVAYLLCTLVYLDNIADTHDPRAHQSLFCPSTPVQTPNSARRGVKKKSTQICRYVYPLVIFTPVP